MGAVGNDSHPDQTCLLPSPLPAGDCISTTTQFSTVMFTSRSSQQANEHAIA